MKKIISLTESDLTRIVKQIISENDKKLKSLNENVLKYSSPLPAEISKSLDKKKKNGKARQNVFKIVTKNTTRYYSIIGNTLLTGRNELHFRDISKKSDGAMVFNRFVKGGVKAEIIPFSKMKTVLTAMSKGHQKINPAPGIYFNKIS